MPKNETRKEKEEMRIWRAAAHNVVPTVFEGARMELALKKVGKLNKSIGKLYILSHGEGGHIGKFNEEGDWEIDTISNLTGRIRKSIGMWGDHAPQSVELYSCFAAVDTKNLQKIGKAFGAKIIHGAEKATFTSSFIIKINNRPIKWKAIQRLPRKDWIKYINKTEALKQYDFVLGMLHDQEMSTEEKMDALINVYKKRA